MLSTPYIRLTSSIKSSFIDISNLLVGTFTVTTSPFTIYVNPNNNSENFVGVDDIKDLRLGISNFDSINPLLSNNKEVLNIDKLIFEPLITIDENYKTSLCLATECSKT